MDKVKIFNIVFFLLVLSVNLSSASVYNLTIQPDGTAGKDNYVDQQNPTTNYGNAVSILLDNENNRALRPILYFNISTIPTGSNVRILNATLEMYMTANAGIAVDSEIRRITSYWGETTSTWNNRDTATAWTTAGGDYASTIYNTSQVTTALGWDAWTITSLIREFHNGTYTNEGILIKGATETGGNNGKTFGSSDSATPSERPKLTIYYEINEPPVITSLSPANNSVYDMTSPSPVNVPINVSVTDDFGLANCSLYTNTSGSWGLYQTNPLTGTSNSTNWNLALSYGNYLWNVECCDYPNNCTTSSNRTFTINKILTLSNINSVAGVDKAHVIWDANFAVNGSVNYGKNLSLGSIKDDAVFYTNKNIYITGLDLATTYYYNITSCTSDEFCVTYGIYSFTTSDTPLLGFVTPNTGFNEDPSFLFKKETNSTIFITCSVTDDTLCSSNVLCDTTIFSPSGGEIISNANMYRGAIHYEYDINGSLLNETGVYRVIATCNDGMTGTGTFTFEVTPTGDKLNISDSLLYVGILIVILIIFIVSILRIFLTKSLSGIIAMISISYFLLIGIVFMSGKIINNFMPTLPAMGSFLDTALIVLIIGLFPLTLFFIIYLLYYALNEKEIGKMQEMGYSSAEAKHFNNR